MLLSPKLKHFMNKLLNMQHLDKCAALIWEKRVNCLFNVHVLVFLPQQGEAEAER